MHVKLSSLNAKKAFAGVAELIQGKSSIPAMGSLLLSATSDGLTVRAVNDLMTVTVQVKAEVLSPGAIMLPGKRLSTICAELAGPDVEIEAQPDHLSRIALVSAPSRFTLNGLPEDGAVFTPHSIEQPSSISIKQSALAGALTGVSYAVSRDESRAVLCGVCFEVEKSCLTLVATDGRRLSRSVIAGTESPKNFSFILPDRTLAFLRRMLGHGENVVLNVGDRAASFVVDTDPKGPFSGPVTITSRLVQGKFPDYRKVIPGRMPTLVKVPREHLLHALARVSLVLTEKMSSVHAEVTKTGIKLSAKNPETGESNENVPVNYGEGEGVSVRFNPSLLAESLRGVAYDEITLELGDSLTPIKVLGGSQFTGVVMPVRIS